MMERGMSGWQRDGSASNETATKIEYETALRRGILAIVDGLPPMIVMVETSEQLVVIENPTMRKIRMIVRIVTENERRSRLGWTLTSLLLAATV